MSDAVKVIKVGDTRRIRERLKPGEYDLCNGSVLVLSRSATMEKTQVFEYEYPLIRRGARWRTKHWHHETLVVLPTRWERVRAFFWGRPEPLPRAVVIIDRMERP